MSLLANHGVIGGHRLTPVVVSVTATADGTGTGTTVFTVTPLVTPTAGNLLVIMAGGSQNRNVNLPPSGFTTVASLGATGSNWLFWKIATGSEPANYTVEWNLSLSGGINLMEISRAETTSPIFFHISSDTSGSQATLAVPSYNALTPGIAITYAAKSTTSNWTVDNSFTNLSAAGEHKKAYRVYSVPALSESTTWSGPSQVVCEDFVFIRGKLI